MALCRAVGVVTLLSWDPPPKLRSVVVIVRDWLGLTKARANAVSLGMGAADYLVVGVGLAQQSRSHERDRKHTLLGGKPKEEVFGDGHPGVIDADIPAQNFGQDPQNPGKTSILARTSMTRRRGRP